MARRSTEVEPDGTQITISGQRGKRRLAVHLLDEMLDHLLGDVDVGDDAVAQRPDRLDLVGGLAHHQLGVVADRLDALDAVDRLDRDHRRLVEDDAAAADIDDGVGGAEVDRHVVRRQSQEVEKRHIWLMLSCLEGADGADYDRAVPNFLYRMAPRPRSTKE